MTSPAQLPPVAPQVVAAAVEALTSRLRKKLDAAIEQFATAPTETDADGVHVTCGADAVVTLSPGPSGAVTGEEAASCTCLLAPRCLHRAAVLGACPVADPAETADPAPVAAEPAPERKEPTAAQKAAASAVWTAATATLAAGVPAAGAVLQAELLRAAHAARLAGLFRAEAAALRVVRGLRAARSRRDDHRLADLVSTLQELLFTAGLLAAGDTDPALVGTARRGYEPRGSLRVFGVCREPVISATGYGGVVTHVVSEDGRWFSIADVKPGGSARARGAATATVAMGGAPISHARLARDGLLITGATVSPDGRLGAGRGVRVSPAAGLPWSGGSRPLASLFARPLAEAVAAETAEQAASGSDANEGRRGGLVGCDLVVVGTAKEFLLARELREPAAGTGPVIRLAAADAHPDLVHTANLRQLASRPGLRIRVVGRLDLGQAVTLHPLAVGPVPGADGVTLRLPDEWAGQADLGYDRLQGAHLPTAEACAAAGDFAPVEVVDPLADSPLWRARRLVELAVAGGRRAVAEPARAGGIREQAASLRRAGFHSAAELATGLTGEADRRERNAFGRLTDSGNDRYAWAWLAAATHLAATERALVQASWQAGPLPLVPAVVAGRPAR